MAELFDRLCRILATPMPRSRALKLILGGLAGAVLTPFAFGQQCPPPRQCAGVTGNCCPPSQKCCPGPNHCCPNNSTCCGGNSCCTPSQNCVNGVCQGGPSPGQPD